MPYLKRDGIALHYEEAGSGGPPLLLVHGFGGDLSHFAPQYEHFRRHHRVVAVDRRGHGLSDKPEQTYSIAAFADDLAWTCRELGLYRPMVVVHSQGGLGLEFAARYPELAGSLVTLDAPFFAPPPMRTGFEQLALGLRSPHYREALRGMAEAAVFKPTDEPARKARIIEAMCALPQHVLASTWEQYLAHDEAAAAAGCHVPLLCILGAFPADVERLRAVCPQVAVGQVIGSGHFIQLEVPEQVNAMLERFLAASHAEQAAEPVAV
jgi:pimeloyl-ACP methyl ester carboxylesterase